jgi:thiol-disulfide isomerase/thioredoxin
MAGGKPGLDVFAATVVIVAGSLGGLWIQSSRGQEAANDDGERLAAHFQMIVAASKARDKQFHDELRKAGRDQKRVSQANQDYSRDHTRLVMQCIELLRSHRSDPAFPDGMAALVADLSYPPPDDLLQAMKEHIESPKLGRVCAELGSRGSESWSREILELLSERSPNRSVRGRATLALGEYYRYPLLPWAHDSSKANLSQAIDRARRYYKRVIDEFGDIPYGKRSLGEQAGLQIKRLDNLPNLTVGRPAPDIVGRDLDGQLMSLAQYQGKVTMLVFWGSWCGPCMKLVPHEIELAARHRDQPFALVGVNGGDDLETARATVAKRGMTWRHWWDEGETRNGPIQIAYNVQQWPTVYLLDRAGVIRFIDPPVDELDKAVESLLK